MPRVGTVGWICAYACLGVVALGCSLLMTSPEAIGPVGVTLWFVGFYSVVVAVLTLALYGLKSYFGLHQMRPVRLRYSLRQGLLLGGWLCGMLALSSLGQLGWRDVILLAIAAGIVELYVRLRWP